MSTATGKGTTADLAALASDVLSGANVDAMMAQDDFAAVSLAIMDNWGPHAEDDASMTRTLRDVGHYMAGIWALALHGSPDGLSHASLSQMVEPLGFGSRARVHAMLVYLQVIGLIRPLPTRGDGRYRRYAPTPALEALFRARFRRELALSAPLIREADEALARWDEPGVFEAFMAATARLMAGSFMILDRKAPSLDVVSQRNAGLVVLGQMVVMANAGFPPKAMEVNLSELAKRSGVSRQQARNILKVGETAGFWRHEAGGRLAFSGLFDFQLRVLMASYILHLGWCGRQALGAVDAASRTGRAVNRSADPAAAAPLPR